MSPEETYEERQTRLLLEELGRSPSKTPRTQEAENKNTIAEAFQYAVDQPLENIGITLETLGAKDVGSWLKEITEEPENYESSTAKFINSQGDGYQWNNFGLALVEQAGQLVGSIATRVGGAGVGALVGGAPGAVVGGLAGPALFEAIQQLGPIVQERLRRDGREGQEPTWQDWTAAAAGAGLSGSLNAIGVRNVGVLNRELIKSTTKAAASELGTETVQEIIQEVASGAGTEEGIAAPGQIAKQAFGAGLLGGGTAGGVQLGVGGVSKIIQPKPIEPTAYNEEEFTEQVDLETQQRLDNLRINEADNVESLIEILQGLEKDFKPTGIDTRESLINRIRSSVKEQVQKDFLFDEIQQDILAPLNADTIRRQELDRFNAMSPVELADYVEANIGVDNYESWARNQFSTFDPSVSAEYDYRADRIALAQAAANDRIRDTGLSYVFDPNEYVDYIGQITEKYSLQDLRDIAVGYMGMDRETTNVKTANQLARDLADQALTYRLQEEKLSEKLTNKSDSIDILPEQENEPRYRNEMLDSGNAISVQYKVKDTSLPKNKQKDIVFNFQRTNVLNPKKSNITEEVPEARELQSAGLFLSEEQVDPKAQEIINSEIRLTPGETTPEQFENYLGQFFNNYEGQLSSMELPQGSLPKFKTDVSRKKNFVNKLVQYTNEYFRPYGELGLETQRRIQDNTQRQRALTENAQDMAEEYEKGVLAAYKQGLLGPKPETIAEKVKAKAGIKYIPQSARDEYDRLAMAYLKRTGARLKLDEETRAEYEKEIAKLNEELQEPQTEETRQEILKQIEEYEIALSDIQKARVAADQLPEPIRNPLIKIRASIDALTQRIIDSQKIKLTPEEKLTLEEGINRYVTRSFAIFEPGLGYNPKFSKDWLNSKEAQELYDKAVQSVLYMNRFKSGFTEATARAQVDRIIKLEEMSSAQDLFNLPGILRSTENAVALESGEQILKTRKILPYAIRKLMGEITDPAIVATTSLQRLSRLVEQSEFYSDIKEISQRPGENIFTPEKMGQYNVPLGNPEGNAEQQFNPLDGLYTTKEIAEVIGREVESSNSTRNMIFQIYDLVFLVPKALTQLGIIVLSPATQARNFLGGGLMFMANGYASGESLDKATTAIKHNLFGRVGYDSEGRLTAEGRDARRLFKRMQELGIVNTSVRLNEAADMFSRLSDRSGSTVGRMGHALQALKQTGPGKTIDFFGGNTLRGAQKLYAATDDFWKMAAFGADRMRIRKMLDNIDGENVTDEIKLKILKAYAETLTTKIGTDYRSNLARTIRTTDLEEYIDEVAAYHVRMGMPNYDYVGKFAQVIRQLPLGNFIAFPTEILRTAGGNLPMIAYKQMSFKIPTELMIEGGIKTQRPLIKNEDGTQSLGNAENASPFRSGGIKRAVLGGAAVYGVGSTLQLMGQYLYDVDDEDLEAVRATQPDYARNSRLMPLSKIKDGKGQFINLDYILPYEGFASIGTSLMRALNEGELTGEGVPKSVVRGMAEYVLDYTSAYTDTAISSKVFGELLINLDLDTRKRIWNPEDNWGDVMEDMFDHAIDNAGPGAVSQFRDIYKSLQEGDDRYDRYLRDKDTLLAFSKLLGIATTEMDANEGFGFKVNSYKRILEDGVEKNLQNLAFTGETLTEEDVMSEWMDANDIWYRTQQQIYFDIQAYERVGMTNKKLREQLKRLQAVPGVDPSFTRNIKKGIFTPYRAPTYVKKRFEESKKKLQEKQRERGLDPADILRTWPTSRLSKAYRKLKTAKYNLTESPSLPPLEED
jgi:hypothetical protein